jgi:MFS family permease
MAAAACSLGVLYVGSTVLTPLYGLYREAFGFGELVVTEIYAVYVVGNLAVLFFFGRLSDQIGRRTVALLALLITLLSTLVFVAALGTAWLFPARVLNGFAAGLGAGALTAWIAELAPKDSTRAAVVASASNLAGLAFGALGAGVLARHAPWPLRTSFVVYLAVLLVTMAALWRAPETVAARVRRLREVALRPRIGIPRGIRLPFAGAAAMAFAAFALGGFYAALTPGLLARDLHQDSPAVIGIVVALFFGSAAATAVVTGALASRRTIDLALALLVVGVALLLAAEARGSMALLIAATLINGPAVALGYRGSLQVANEIAPPDRHAEIVSSYLLVCYTANALPVLGVGLLTESIGAVHAHRALGAMVVLLALVAGAIARRYAATAGRGRRTAS